MRVLSQRSVVFVLRDANSLIRIKYGRAASRFT